MINFDENCPESLAYDDISLVPQFNNIRSRADVDLSVNGKLGYLRVGVLSSPMDTISESGMLLAMAEFGGMGVMHRFMPPEKLKQEVENFRSKAGEKYKLALSCGVNDREQINFAVDSSDAVFIDIAHGDSIHTLDTIKYIRAQGSKGRNIVIVAGSVATGDAVRRLANAGADVIRVGVGSGSLCVTRRISGSGVAMATTLDQCVEAAQEFDDPPEIIADGGIRNSGDAAKAFALGADYIMTGSLLAGTDETPAEIKIIDGRPKKEYRGMASLSVQKQLGKITAPEGVSKFIDCKGPVKDTLHTLEWGLRSSLTYSGARDLATFRAKAKFTRVTSQAHIEGLPHGALEAKY